jgi:hypothetical protein
MSKPIHEWAWLRRLVMAAHLALSIKVRLDPEIAGPLPWWVFFAFFAALLLIDLIESGRVSE